jgi:hypothetical protein
VLQRLTHPAVYLDTWAIRLFAETPAGELDMLVLYANAVQQRGYPSVREWFEHMHTDRAKIAGRRIAMAQEFLDGVNGLRKAI